MRHLNAFFTLLAVLLSLGTAHAQPTKTLTGRVIGEGFEAMPMARICAGDTTTIGTTDMDGYFKIEVPVDINTLIFMSVGWEWANVKLSGECSNLEVILLYDFTYDFISVRRVNRKMFKRFKRLPQIHQEAYEKGLFKSPAPCASPIFNKWIPLPAKRSR